MDPIRNSCATQAKTWWTVGLATLLTLIGTIRILASYSHTAQSFDEPCHVAAGIEYLDRGTYLLDPVHPPLSRVAIALPLYLSGERYPKLDQNDPMSQNYNVVGNHILYDSGHLVRNLALARLGVLPFFVLGAVVVGLWAGQVGGTIAAVVAVLLYTTTPSILAFSSIAYTDIVASSTQVTAMFVYSLWLARPNYRRTLFLGVALGLAFLAKLTSLLFLFVAIAFMTVVWFLRRDKHGDASPTRLIKNLPIACVVTLVLVWGGYRFSVAPLHVSTGITAANMPSFQHFPAPLRSIARSVILRDTTVPAPDLIHGVAMAWVLNKTASQSYLLGHIKTAGWWYFFLLALAVKLPIPLLIILLLGLIAVLQSKSRQALLPLVALVSILLITMPVSYQVGSRHVLVALPLIAITAGIGVAYLLEWGKLRTYVGLTVMVLLTWQVGESISSQSDFLAYFNEFSGKDPSAILVMGCDLDCGQDLFRLARELHARHISKIGLAIWSSADLDRSGLPAYYIPDPTVSPQGWVAVSARARRIGDVLHTSLPLEYFTQIEQLRPEAYIGKTIWLYHFPDPGTAKVPAPAGANKDGSH